MRRKPRRTSSPGPLKSSTSCTCASFEMSPGDWYQAFLRSNPEMTIPKEFNSWNGDDEVGKDIKEGTVHVPGKAVKTLTVVKNMDGEREGLIGVAPRGKAATGRQGVSMVDAQAQAPQRTASQDTWRGLLGGVRRDPGRRGPRLRLGQVGRRAQPRRMQVTRMWI